MTKVCRMHLFQPLLVLILALSLTLGAVALPLPKALTTTPFAGADRAAISLGDYRGKTLVLFVAGRKSYNSAYEQAIRLTREWGNNDNVAAFLVADLGGVPGFVKGVAQEALVKSHREANSRLPAGTCIVTMLDWEGTFAKQLDIVGESNDVYLLYVVDRRGQIVLRITQKVNDLTEEQVFRMTQGGVQKALGR